MKHQTSHQTSNALTMEKEKFPEMSESFSSLTWLLAREDFIHPSLVKILDRTSENLHLLTVDHCSLCLLSFYCDCW
jgi:hypothetical protein